MTVWPSPASLTGSSAGSVSTCPPCPPIPPPSPLCGANRTPARPVHAGLYTGSSWRVKAVLPRSGQEDSGPKPPCTLQLPPCPLPLLHLTIPCPQALQDPRVPPLPLPLHSPLLSMHPTFPFEAVCWPAPVLPRALPFSAHYFLYQIRPESPVSHTHWPNKGFEPPCCCQIPSVCAQQGLTPGMYHTGPSPNAKGTLGLSTCPTESIIP